MRGPRFDEEVTDSMQQPSALVWFRRDLRCTDHAALYYALRHFARVYAVFVFDTEILDALPSREDARVEFIWHGVAALDAGLRQCSPTETAGLLVRHGRARDCIPRLAADLGVAAVYANEDYEPAARERDQAVEERLRADGRHLKLFKDQVVFAKDEVLTQAGRPFSVFTPYREAWLRRLTPFYLQAYPVGRYTAALAAKPTGETLPDLAQLGFAASAAPSPVPAGMAGAASLLADFRGRIRDYRRMRDYPAVKGVSYLSAHLRFGTVSIRELAAFAWHEGGEGAECWLGELIWRDFYHMILWHHPHVVTHCYRPEYEGLVWDEVPGWFEAWCEGRTGYPLVDAAMRQLNRSGYMHNRLRMITASFLCKDLGLDWRRGENYFAERLTDFDLAANNGGWQWAASTGCDAQPYFRIFNPVTQSERFDPEGRFIRRYVPELANVPDKFIHAPWKMPAERQRDVGVSIGRDYPAPLVDHAEARLRTLARFGKLKA